MTRSRVLLAVKAAVSIGLLAWLVRTITERQGVDAIAERLGSLSPVALALAVALHAVAVLSGVARWRVLLGSRGLDLPLPWLVRSFLIGRFIGAFTPSTAGLDGWRGYEVAKRTGDAAGSASVLVVEKLIGLVGMAIVCAVLMPLGALTALGRGAIVATFGLALAACAGIYVLSSPSRMRALASIAPGPFRARAAKLAEALAADRLSFRTLASAIALGIATHVVLSAVFVATGAALGLAISPTTLLATGNAVTIAVSMPISIGGIGVREMLSAALLVPAGVSEADAVLVAVLAWLTGQVPALLGGALLALDRSTTPAALERVDAVAPPAS